MAATHFVGKIVAVLACLQGVFGVMRGIHWFRLGSDLLGQGLLLLPMVGVVAWLRGFLLLTIAALFGIFAIALWKRRPWAKALGLTIAAVNILLVLGAFAQEAALGEAMLWSAVPVAMIVYLSSASAGVAAAAAE